MKRSLIVKFRILLLALAFMTLQGSALFGAFEWLNSDVSGDWETDANWKDDPPGAPNAADAVVLLKDTTGNSPGTTTITVTSGGGRTVGSLSIDNENNDFTLAGTELIFDNSGVAFLTSKGSHLISTKLDLNDKLSISVTGSLNISGVISGSGGIETTEAGTLTLGGDNTYSGSTTLSKGTIVVTHNNALGASGVGNGTTVSKGAVLSVSGSGLDIGESLTLNGEASTSTDGELQNSGGDNTWSGNISLSTDSTIGASSGTELTVSGIISGSGGLTKESTGTLTLTGVNTYGGDTTINAGTLKLNASGGEALDATNNTITVNDGGTLLLGASNQIDVTTILKLDDGTFETGGFDETMKSLTLTKGSSIDFGDSSDSVIHFTDTFDWNHSTDEYLTLINFNGEDAGLGGKDELIFDTNPTVSNRAQIQFLNPVGYTPGTYAAKLDGTNLIPDGIPIIPEPSAMIGTGLLSGLIFLDLLRRRKQRREEEEAETA